VITANDSGDDDALSGGAVAGIVIACIVVCIVIVGALYWVYTKQTGEKLEHEYQNAGLTGNDAHGPSVELRGSDKVDKNAKIDL